MCWDHAQHEATAAADIRISEVLHALRIGRCQPCAGPLLHESPELPARPEQREGVTYIPVYNLHPGLHPERELAGEQVEHAKLDGQLTLLSCPKTKEARHEPLTFLGHDVFLDQTQET